MAGTSATGLFGWDVSSFSLLGIAVAVAWALLLFLYRLVMDAMRVA